MSDVLKIGTRIGYVNGDIINLGTIESREGDEYRVTWDDGMDDDVTFRRAELLPLA